MADDGSFVVLMVAERRTSGMRSKATGARDEAVARIAEAIAAAR